jgi:hypothetical protein
LSSLGLGASLAGTGLSVLGQYQAGQSQAAAYKYNAKMQEQQALDAERRGSMAEAKTRQRANLILGQQHAQQGGSGLVAGADSGGDVLAQTAEYGAEDAAMARLNGAREAWGYRTGAGNTRFEAAAAKSASNARLGSTFLTGTANAFGGATPWWESLKQPAARQPYTERYDNWY